MLMKKAILLSAALLCGMATFAQEGTDVTPANYKIGTPGVQLPLANNPGFLNNINIAGANVWDAINGNKYWNNGLVLIGSGGGMTEAQWQDFMDSWNYVNFGGEIGRTACFITSKCTIADVLNDLAPSRADEWDNLNMITNQYGGGAINFFMDPNNSPTTGFIRVKFVFNIYNNDFSGGAFIQSFGMRGNQNNNASDGHVQDLMPGTAFNNDVCMDENTGEWDPTRWVEMYYDFLIPGNDEDGTSYIPPRIKMFFQGGQATKESAMFFKEISFTHFEGEPEYLEKAQVNYLTLTQDLANVTSDEPSEEPAVDLYLIGSNVDGQEWALGTNQMTYADGVYTWTGSVLGNGFKINNGSWDNPDYNIGSDGSALLTLGTPFTVVANGDAQDIKLADYVSVENATVVYNPSDMTVTVTGTGVEAPAIPELYVRGVMNGWGATDQMTESNGVYTYKFESVSADAAEFKIADSTWGVHNYGGEAMIVYCNKPGVQTLVSNGANVTISNWVEGPMEITFDLANLELTVAGANQPEDPTTGIESIDNENAPVEYYNLQGVKVADPSNGIFIKKQGSKTSKVVVR